MVVKETLREMLDPYVPECRYLLEAELDFPTARGNFSIPHPFYCIQTGHFNAVELMLCYNQLTYTMFAEWFDEGKIESTGTIPLEEYKKLQAGSSHIARVDKLRFSRPIDPTDFHGTITLKKSRRMKNLVFFSTEFEFRDSKNGKATGEALLALVLDL